MSQSILIWACNVCLLLLLEYIHAVECICGQTPDIDQTIFRRVFAHWASIVEFANLLLLNNLLFNFNTQCIPTLVVCVLDRYASSYANIK